MTISREEWDCLKATEQYFMYARLGQKVEEVCKELHDLKEKVVSIEKAVKRGSYGYAEET